MLDCHSHRKPEGWDSQESEATRLVLHRGPWRLREEKSSLEGSESLEEGVLTAVHELFTALFTTTLFDFCCPHFVQGSLEAQKVTLSPPQRSQ